MIDDEVRSIAKHLTRAYRHTGLRHMHVINTFDHEHSLDRVYSITGDPDGVDLIIAAVIDRDWETVHELTRQVAEGAPT